jgi:parvulin-like peptidyl-prolyl isomerase
MYQVSKSLLGVTFLILSASMGAASANAPTEPAPPIPLETILASNQWTSITYQELKAEMARIPLEHHVEILLDKQRLGALVDSILINKTLALEARKSRLDEQPHIKAEIQTQVDKVLAKYRGQEVQRTAKPADYAALAREFYLAYPSAFVIEPRYKVWHVLISNKGRTPQAAKSLAEGLRVRVLANEPLETIAKASEDPSAERNKGHLGTITAQGLDDRFIAKMKTMKTGDVSDVVETQFGYHVIKMLELIPEQKVSFERFKPSLIAQEEKKYLDGVWDQHVKAIRNDPKLVVNTEALDAIRPKFPGVLSDSTSPQVADKPSAK